MNKTIFLPNLFNEALNGALLILATFALGVFIQWLWNNRHDRYSELRPALAISALFLGEVLVRSVFWLGRHWTNNDVTFNNATFYSLAFIGGVVQIWGICCCMKVFEYRNSKYRVYLVAIGAAILWNAYWMHEYFVGDLF